MIKARLLRKLGILFLCGSFAYTGASIVASSYAYLTDYDYVKNVFTTGNVNITLEEPGWKEPIITPSTFKKDPFITNTGKNPAYVYLEVRIPIRNIYTYSDDGTSQSKGDTELFTFQPDNSWYLLSSKKQNDEQVYIFGYNKIIQPAEKTNPLFETVTLVNVVEGELSDQSIHIPVYAYGIQTIHTESSSNNPTDPFADRTTPTEFVNQLKAAFTKYYNQNKESPKSASGLN